jgi:uncharacterized protein YecE (DUF72 family)
MHFGRVASLKGINLHLPYDSARTEKFLALPRETHTRLYVGCPIWASKNWLGGIYPEGTKASDFLSVYASQFNTVEVNSTFYNMLNADRIAHWRDETPPGFKFCPKVFRGITESLSSPKMAALVKEFCESIAAFEDRLGLTFDQFSDYFSPNQMEFLKKFLKAWPKSLPLAVELRHPLWFNHHALLDEVVNLFYRNHVSTVITDTPGRRDVLHLSLTQPKVLVRFQGNEGDASDEERLSEWGDRLRKWSQAHLEEIYFFTHQPEDPNIPGTAKLAEETFNLTLAPTEKVPLTIC